MLIAKRTEECFETYIPPPPPPHTHTQKRAYKLESNFFSLFQGIYRVSGVKSTVENLCQRFEIDPESVLLQNENPNVISNVLKLYLRQLPEPLLTFKYYQHFIQVAKVSCYINTPILYTTFFAAVKKTIFVINCTIPLSGCI